MNELAPTVFVPPAETTQGVLERLNREKQQDLRLRVHAISPSRAVGGRGRGVLRRGPLLSATKAVYLHETQTDPEATIAWLDRSHIHTPDTAVNLFTQAVTVDSLGGVEERLGQPFRHASFGMGRMALHESYDHYSLAQMTGLLEAISVTIGRLERAHTDPLTYANLLVA